MSEQKAQEKEPISREEMERRKAEITKFHKEQIEFLETQFRYEDLLTQIEESRLRRAVAMVRHAQMLAPDEPEEKAKEEVKPEGKTEAPTNRTLKKEKNEVQS